MSSANATISTKISVNASTNATTGEKIYSWPKKAPIQPIPSDKEIERTAKLTEELLKTKREHESADYAKAKAEATKLESEANNKLNKITDEFKKSHEVNNTSNQTIKISSQDMKKHD